MGFSLRDLFNGDSRPPRTIKTPVVAHNRMAVEFLNDNFQNIWADTDGRAQLIARRNSDNSYDLKAKYHREDPRLYVHPMASETVATGISHTTVLQLVGGFKQAAALNRSTPRKRYTPGQFD